MARKRVVETPAPTRRRQFFPALPSAPADVGGAAEPARDLLLRSWPGRLFVVAAAIKLLVAAIRLVGEPPRFVQVLSSTATLALAIALLYFVVRLFLLVKRRLLWRVRRKLILSYIFIGVVPALLIFGFALVGAIILSFNISAFMFKDGYEEIIRNAVSLAEAASVEISRTPDSANYTVSRVQQNGSAAFDLPALSMAFVPESPKGSRVAAGPWDHLQNAPTETPEWVKKRNGWEGTIVVANPDRPGRLELVARAVRHAASTKGRIGQVIVDIPVDGTLIDRLYEQTGVKAGMVDVGVSGTASESVDVLARADSDAPDSSSLFRRSVVFLDSADWTTGAPGRASVSMTYRVADLYNRIAEAQSVNLPSNITLPQAFTYVLIFVAALFLIIQFAAITMGLALARSITSSIHELFMGTERVRQGDLTHRIDVHTKDQLGELADSFNQMTGSIENLLQTAAEKKRLEEELRIARQIQMSLLPRGPLEVPGLGVTALCVPAREVGGDYYDFFPLGDQKLGVLIADVSGKGTSAALYMAELKGLVLSLSQIYQSPRELLLEVNRIISDNLDSRSFITMSYAVLDLKERVMTFARAGHTPLIYLPSIPSKEREARILTPSGMVVGLRIDGAAAKFAELLEEEEVALHGGDVFVLFTDGITEAMNSSQELFGESRLSSIVAEHGHLATSELRERILREIEAFVGAADQHDDMTMILIKVERAEAARVAV
jgi:sigma-B regulation protein RsbU (phosphoserine phosphatase)